MTDFWSTLALAALIIIGVWNAFGEGMVFEAIGDYMESEFPPMVNKPIFTCISCMASLHGTWVWLATGHSLQWRLALFVLALSGFMRLISGKLLK